MLVFSGIWPHVKLASALFGWFVPMNERTRTRWLYWSAALASWSFFDVAVVILCSLSLRASVHEDIAGLASAGFAVAVHPLAGTYWFCAAVVLSAFTSHLAVMHHSHLTRKHVRGPDPGETAVEKRLYTEWNAAGTVYKKRPTVRFAVYAALGTCAALTVCGAVSPWATARYRLPVFNDDVRMSDRRKWTVVIEDFAVRGNERRIVPIANDVEVATTKASVEAMVTLLDAADELPDVPSIPDKSWSPFDVARDLAFDATWRDGIRSDDGEGGWNGFTPVGQWFLSGVFLVAVVAAPMARLTAHWLSFASTWFGLVEHDRLVRFGAACGRFGGVEVTLLALAVMCARMREASEALSERFGGCVSLTGGSGYGSGDEDGDDDVQCFAVTLRLERGAWIALCGACASGATTWALGRLQENARAAVVEGAFVGGAGDDGGALISKVPGESGSVEAGSTSPRARKGGGGGTRPIADVRDVDWSLTYGGGGERVADW